MPLPPNSTHAASQHFFRKLPYDDFVQTGVPSTVEAVAPDSRNKPPAPPPASSI